MAKRRRSKRAQRDDNTIASSHHLTQLLRLPVHPASSMLRLIEDRREWHPLGDASPAGASRRSARSLVLSSSPVAPRPFKRVAPPQLKFRDPANVAVCVRRQQRREVLHALKRNRGRGGARRRTWRSDIRCK